MRKLKTTELNRLSTEQFKESSKMPIAVVLDNVRSAMNVGSVFRTSDAFLIEKIYLVGITATPPNRDIQKSALGATETVEWEYRATIQECMEALRQADYTILCVEQSDRSVLLNEFTVNPQKKYALILGNEVDGVSQYAMDQCHYCLEIPQFGMKHSLNISVCAGIVMWELISRLKWNH